MKPFWPVMHHEWVIHVRGESVTLLFILLLQRMYHGWAINVSVEGALNHSMILVKHRKRSIKVVESRLYEATKPVRHRKWVINVGGKESTHQCHCNEAP